jgi:L-amino acid N-acyltransferase YncA
MTLNLDDLVELDRLNMAPVIERAGGKFDPAFRRKKLLAEQEQGAEFLCVERQGRIVAYLECIRESDGTYNVLSIQIHPSHQTGFVLRELLGMASDRLTALAAGNIHSSVHMTNRASLELHRKLGFEECSRTQDRILFQVDAAGLRDRLRRFPKR